MDDKKAEMEKYKNQAKSIARNGIIIGCIITVILIVVVIITKFLPLLIFEFFIVPTVAIVTLILSSIPYSKYKVIYKDYYVKKALDSIFTDLEYKPNEGISETIISNTKMMNMGDNFESNDYFTGKYKNNNVEQADVTITEERERENSEGEKEEYTVTLFRGKWMIFDFNKPFKANMQVKSKWFDNSKIINWGSDIKYKRVKLEDEEFNKYFTVYAQDEEEAFYILTPHFMDKIKKVSNNVSGELLLCFIDNKLHIGLDNNNDSFEPSMLSNYTEEQINNNILADIKVITNFIDQLNLDNDLFKKED